MTIRPTYPTPLARDPWLTELLRQLQQRDISVNNALRPQTAFLATTDATTAFNSGSATDVNFATEIFDLGNRYDSAKLYYSPTRGVYTFVTTLTFSNTATVATDWLLTIKTTSRDYEMAFTTPDTALVFSASLVVPAAYMSVDDTAKVQITRLAGAGTITLAGDADRARFGGHLVEVA